ncbi:TonB-dependent receptor [Chryseobacterium taklimakanense]|uniref:SusC/RagA family TonB-linked outer membrane protein n=1 Tax=Chryseobacterium taklimakanense TaxID=536441 RepID=UPI000F5E6B20|nr:TonB-dependent receptor [Chryseobacterium taklimakanense]AZI22821.1 TonB-dependent receptor [Chryseobacterium taklimakanense]
MKKMNTNWQIPACNKAALFFALTVLPYGIMNAQQTPRDTLRENKIEEVVVIGYGTQKKGDVNSAVSSIKSQDLQNVKQVSVDQMIQGKLSGVTVTNSSGQPGSAVSIKVRGATSINGTNEPLYIIDGVPLSGDATGKSTSGRPVAGNDFSSTGGSGSVAVSPISFLNPNDIESIDVLKDASATAIYGSRGANGVILITTKSGKKGVGKISYEGFTSVATIYKYLDVLKLPDYARLQNAMAGVFNTQIRPEFAHPELLGNGTDWQKTIYRTALSQSHQVAFSGGKDDTNYYTSVSFLDQEGTIINTGLKRYTFRANLNTKIKPWLRVGTNLTGGISNENYTINQSYNGLISNTLLQAPDLPVYNADGSYASPPAGQNVNYFNPVAEALDKVNKLIRKNVLGNLYAEADLYKGLKYRIEISANTEFAENTEFWPQYNRGSQSNDTADLWLRNNDWYSTNLKNLLTYNFALGNHKFTALLGQEALDTHWKGTTGEGHGFVSNDIYSLSLAEDTNVTSYRGSQSLSSYFARLIYDFNNRYGLTASVRRDQSSKFDPVAKNGKNQVGYFPAISASWKVTNEPFMSWLPADVISNLKFRAGYGETGNQQIPNNLYASLLTIYNTPSFLNNPDLTWETMKQTNIGVDLTLIKRLNMSIDWYNKESSDFLFRLPLPDYLTGGNSYYGGIESPYSNIGAMSNKGIDFSLNYDTRGDGLTWSTSLVLSHYKNKLLSLVNGMSNIDEKVNINGYQPMVATNTLIGNPIGTFWGFKSQGLYRTDSDLSGAPTIYGKTSELGDLRYEDINGDGNINDLDKTIIGNPHPDLTFGFTNNFKYKSFDLSIFIQGSLGNDILNLTRRNGTQNAMMYQNQLTEAMDFWSPSNPNATQPRLINSTSHPNIMISDRYVEKGDYVRLQNVTLGYTVSPEFSSQLQISKLRMYVTSQNLLTVTNYTGYDPEIGAFNQNVLLTGVDNGRYPTPRTFIFGINLDF